MSRIEAMSSLQQRCADLRMTISSVMRGTGRYDMLTEHTIVMHMHLCMCKTLHVHRAAWSIFVAQLLFKLSFKLLQINLVAPSAYIMRIASMSIL